MATLTSHFERNELESANNEEIEPFDIRYIYDKSTLLIETSFEARVLPQPDNSSIKSENWLSSYSFLKTIDIINVIIVAAEGGVIEG